MLGHWEFRGQRPRPLLAAFTDGVVFAADAVRGVKGTGGLKANFEFGTGSPWSSPKMDWQIPRTTSQRRYALVGWGKTNSSLPRASKDPETQKDQSTFLVRCALPPYTSQGLRISAPSIHA
jgi:hypothetical protein